MDKKLIYHRAEVEKSKASYGEYDNLDFFIEAPNRALQKNSIRIEGDLKITKLQAGADVRISVADNINLDSYSGVNALWKSIMVETQEQGQLEYIDDYPRLSSMVENVINDENDLNSSSRIVEWKTPTREHTRALMSGMRPSATGAGAGDDESCDFSCKPRCCLNRMSDDLSFSKTGWIKITLNLNRVVATLYGIDVNNVNACKYEISNVKLRFVSVPDVNNAVQMRTTLAMKKTIDSPFSNSVSKVPAVCDGVSCVFLEQSKENTSIENNQSLDRFPQISEVQFLFADSTSEYISYVISDVGQMEDLFLESLNSSGHSNIRGTNNNFGLGLSFPPVDLSNQKFNIQINSDCKNLPTQPYLIYMYFHSFVNI